MPTAEEEGGIGLIGSDGITACSSSGGCLHSNENTDVRMATAQ